MKILKTKWYLAEREQDHYRVLLAFGPFRTAAQADSSMFRTAAVQDPTRPSQLLQEKKPEWEGRRITTVIGKRILEFSHIYQVDANAALWTDVEAAFDEWVDALE